MGKGRGGLRAAGFFSGDGEGGIFGVFLGLFLGFLEEEEDNL